MRLPCPDTQWRLILGLCRYAGLRCPSELLGLRWSDVVWDKNRLHIRQSDKLAEHGEKASRVVPIDPRLKPILLASFTEAEPGDVVVTKARDSSVNWRTTFHKIIRRAGFTPWPRTFHNLRASCETDWAERFPAHVCAKWLGHSAVVAARHYLQTRDAHFDLAAGGSGLAPSGPQQSEPNRRTDSGARSAQIPAQHASASSGTEERDTPQDLVLQGFTSVGAETCDSTRGEEWARKAWNMDLQGAIGSTWEGAGGR